MNELLTKMKTSLSKTAGKTILKIEKKSPEILLGIGIVSFVGTVILASKETLRADEVLEYHKKKVKDIKDAKEIAEKDPEGELEYDVQLYRQDLGVQYLKTTGKMIKLYAPAIALGGLSIACFLTSRNIMQKRYLGVVAAYNGLSSVFEEYRRRVVEEAGVDMDRHYRYGTQLQKIDTVEMTEDGKTHKKKELIETMDTALNIPNYSSVFFDDSNPNWDKNPAFSLMFLRSQQNYFNDLLHTRGHVFLNEVLEALGFDHTPEGAVLGWIDGEGDNNIDFGLYDSEKESVRRFINGQDNVILLEFNHCGVIWDRI